MPMTVEEFMSAPVLIAVHINKDGKIEHLTPSIDASVLVRDDRTDSTRLYAVKTDESQTLILANLMNEFAQLAFDNDPVQN